MKRVDRGTTVTLSTGKRRAGVSQGQRVTEEPNHHNTTVSEVLRTEILSVNVKRFHILHISIHRSHNTNELILYVPGMPRSNNSLLREQ